VRELNVELLLGLFAGYCVVGITGLLTDPRVAAIVGSVIGVLGLVCLGCYERGRRA